MRQKWEARNGSSTAGANTDSRQIAASHAQAVPQRNKDMSSASITNYGFMTSERSISPSLERNSISDTTQTAASTETPPAVKWSQEWEGIKEKWESTVANSTISSKELKAQSPVKDSTLPSARFEKCPFGPTGLASKQVAQKALGERTWRREEDAAPGWWRLHGDTLPALDGPGGQPGAGMETSAITLARTIGT